MTTKKLLWAALSIGIFTAGCADAPAVRTDSYSLQVHQAASTQAGIALSVEPITFDNLDRYPGLSIDTDWISGRHGGGRLFEAAEPATPVEEASARVPILPLPSLLVRVSNHSGHSLKLAGAQFTLTDDQGTSYRLYRSDNELDGRVYAEIASLAPEFAGGGSAMDAIQDAIAELPLLNRVTEIKDGQDWQGFLAFDFKVYDRGELDALLRKVGHFSLSVSNAKDDTGASVALSATLDRAKLN